MKPTPSPSKPSGLLRITLWWLTFTVTSSSHAIIAYPKCSICQGRDISQPDALAGVDGASCAEIQEAGDSRQFSIGRCAFLQGFLENRCCHPSNDPTPHKTKTENHHITGSAESTTCYDAVHSNITMCMELLYIGICLGTVDNHPCQACMKHEFGLCGPYATTGGYEMDCSNVNTSYKEMVICDDKLYLEKPSYGTGGGTSSRSSSGGSRFIFYSIVILLIGFYKIVGCVSGSQQNNHSYETAIELPQSSELPNPSFEEDEIPVVQAYPVHGGYRIAKKMNPR